MIKTININTPISQWKPVLSGAHSVQMYNGGKEVGVQVLFTQRFFSMSHGPFSASKNNIHVCMKRHLVLILI